jgi:hypothetical protein
MDALEKAASLFKKNNPEYNEAQKMALISFAVPIAALNRGVDDKDKLNTANDYVLENLERDLREKEKEEPVYHSICFLIAYVDAHVSFGLLGQQKAEEIMDNLCQNYEMREMI